MLQKVRIGVFVELQPRRVGLALLINTGTATLIPIHGSQFQPEFKYIEKNDTYQANFIANEPVLIAPNSTSSYQSLLYAGAKVNSLLQDYSTKYGIDQFDLLIDWGWFYFITKPMFIMIDLVLQISRKFWRCNSFSNSRNQNNLFPASQ